MIMTKILFAFAAMFFLSLGVYSSPTAEDGWLVLAKVKFEPRYVKEYEEDFLFPIFTTGIRSREGKEITLRGHYLPMEFDDTKTIVLSKFPFAACFFCGGAGPESVAEIHFSEKPKRFKADQIITISGILKLNDKDLNHMNFILNNAQLLTP
jgi:hypothetical protein